VPPRNGDWNCTAGVEKFYRPNLNCQAQPGGAACDAMFGFEDDPACGAKGTFITGKTVTDALLLTRCAVGAKSAGTTIQPCK
jgi:hypothetical protein